jgi:hypothetical protein
MTYYKTSEFEICPSVEQLLLCLEHTPKHIRELSLRFECSLYNLVYTACTARSWATATGRNLTWEIQNSNVE